MDQDIRWKQRFQNYDKAVNQLTEFIEKGELNKFEIQGLIQCFEYTFELAWKTMKDFLEESGYDVNSPRATLQMAFSTQLIDEGHLWIEALNKRNLMAHTYDEAIAEEARHLIMDYYFSLLSQFRDDLRGKI